MSSFFTVPGVQKKRKRTDGTVDGPKKKVSFAKHAAPSRTSKPAKAAPRRQSEGDDDESISGSDSESDNIPEETIESGSESENEGETAGEKRLRLAERYLENLKQEVEEVGFNAEDVDRDIIASRLQEDVAESKGKVYKKLAEKLDFEHCTHTFFRTDCHTITSTATCPPHAYTVSKDRVLVKWKIQDLPRDQYKKNSQTTKPKKTAPPRRRPEKVAIIKGDTRKAKDRNYQRHTDEILCVASSGDGKFVATGGADKKIVVYDAKTLKPLKVFGHSTNSHRDGITGLAFRRNTNQLFSASKDRTVKVWGLDELAFVETLFGHQDAVVDVDSLSQERCVSVGARDRTARLWKVIEETQLVFRGGGGDKKNKSGIDPRSMAHEGSMDRITMIDEDLFVTGGDNGSLALWNIQKKKPLFVLPHAHGLDPPLLPSEASAEQFPDPSVIPPPQPRWITALRALPYSDVILSGSWDGHVRAWRLSEDKRKLEPVASLGQPVVREFSGADVAMEDSDNAPEADSTPGHLSWSVKGVVNDISMFMRGEHGKDGLCVVVAVGKEHRLGRWKKVQCAKNGAIVFEVPPVSAEQTLNGHVEKGE